MQTFPRKTKTKAGTSILIIKYRKALDMKSLFLFLTCCINLKKSSINCFQYCKEWAFLTELIGYLLKVRQQISQLIQRVPPLSLQTVPKQHPAANLTLGSRPKTLRGLDRRIFFPLAFFFLLLLYSIFLPPTSSPSPLFISCFVVRSLFCLTVKSCALLTCVFLRCH